MECSSVSLMNGTLILECIDQINMFANYLIRGPNVPRAKDDPTPVYTPRQVAEKVK